MHHASFRQRDGLGVLALHTRRLRRGAHRAAGRRRPRGAPRAPRRAALSQRGPEAACGRCPRVTQIDAEKTHCWGADHPPPRIPMDFFCIFLKKKKTKNFKQNQKSMNLGVLTPETNS